MADSERRGVVVKGLGGLYEVETVDDGESTRIVCRARGGLKRDESKLLIGDLVTVAFPDGEPVISEIAPRRSALIRPPMANLDTIYVTFAAAHPDPATTTIDKLLAIAVHNGIRPVVLVTKADCDGAAAQRYAEIYALAGFSVYTVSTAAGDVPPALAEDLARELSEGHTVAFAGASGVGKSTLLNHLFPNLALETGEISRKTQRGKHTTRHVELFRVGERGFFADTPGFSLLDFAHFDFFGLEDLFSAYPDFAPFLGACRYSDCTHTGEGARECAIARAAEEGKIAPSRHESYRELYRTLKAKNRY